MKTIASGRVDQLDALADCERQILARSLVEQTVTACGLQAVNFSYDENVELYFDVMDGEICLAYVARGWNETAFSVEVLFPVIRDLADGFYARRREFSSFCREHKVKLEINGSIETVDITLRCTITERRFNQINFADTLRRLDQCTHRVTEGLMASALESVTA